MRNTVFTLLILLLSGCASTIHTKVSAFHELEEPLSGVPYALVASKEQEESLEFRSYAKLIKAELGLRGLNESSFNQAKYAIAISYGIDDGKQIVSSYPIIGQTGTSGSHTTGTVTSYGNTASYNGTTIKTPTYGVVGSGTSTDTVFKRYLNIDIIDISKSVEGRVQKVYEGKAISSGSSSQLAPVMPAIIRSVFEDFPGKSGATRTSIQPFKK